MDRKEVMNNLAVTCAAFTGTLAQHEYLQQALRWVNEQLEKAEAVDAAAKPSELKAVDK